MVGDIPSSRSSLLINMSVVLSALLCACQRTSSAVDNDEVDDSGSSLALMSAGPLPADSRPASVMSISATVDSDLLQCNRFFCEMVMISTMKW